MRHRARLVDGSEPKAFYPPPGKSWGIAWRNLLFPLINPAFFWIPAILYTLSAWLASPYLREATAAAGAGAGGGALGSILAAAVLDPLVGLWLLIFIAAFVAFTDTHVKWYRIAGGTVHALAHLLLAFAIGSTAWHVSEIITGLPAGALGRVLLTGAITFVVSGVLGSWLVGFYLFVSLQLFGRHDQHGFSSLRVQDFKGWLRMHIDATGQLTVYAVGIDRVPRRWKNAARAGGALVEPAEGSSTPPHLIEQIGISAPARPAEPLRAADVP